MTTIELGPGSVFVFVWLRELLHDLSLPSDIIYYDTDWPEAPADN